MRTSVYSNTSNESIISSYFSAELKMNVLREREVKDSLERQLTEEQKLRSEFDFKITIPNIILTPLCVTCTPHTRSINFLFRGEKKAIKNL